MDFLNINFITPISFDFDRTSFYSFKMVYIDDQTVIRLPSLIEDLKKSNES